MSGRSLEEVMMGMSMDSTMEGCAPHSDDRHEARLLFSLVLPFSMGGSIGDFSPGNMELGGFDGQGESIENKENGGTQPIKCPMSPAQVPHASSPLAMMTDSFGASVSSGIEIGQRLTMPDNEAFQ